MTVQTRVTAKKSAVGEDPTGQQNVQDVRRLLQRILEALRQGGVSDSVDALEQVALLAYMKLLDEREPAAGSKIFPGPDHRYRWSNFRKRAHVSGLHTFLSEHVIPYLSTLDNDAPAVADYYRGASLKIEDPDTVERVVHAIDGIDFRSLRPDEMGIILEDLLSDAGIPTQFRTPRPLRKLMVQLLDPKVGETVYDPACGTGGFLTEVVTHLETAQGNAKKFDRSQMGNSLFGHDNARRMIRLARMNLELQGIDPINVQRANSVIAYGGLLPREMARQYDVVFCAPPFDGAPPQDEVRTDLPINSTRLEILFLEIAMVGLKPGGRAAILVPDTLLESAGKTYTELRRLLVTDYQVLAIIPLPASTLRQYSATKASIVLFRKPIDASMPRRLQTSAVWYSEVDDIDNPERLVDAWNKLVASDFKKYPGLEAGGWLAAEDDEIHHWWAPIEVIRDNGFDLSAYRYKPRRDAWASMEPDVQLGMLETQLQFASGRLRELKDVRESLRFPKMLDVMGTRKLKDLVRQFSGTTPSKANPAFWVGTTPWVSPKDMKRYVLTDAQDHVSEQAVSDHSSAMVEPGTLLVVNRSMILERKVPIAIAERPLMISQDIFALKPLPDSGIDAWYLFACLTAMESRILAGMQGTTHGSKRLARDVLLDLDIPIPSPDALDAVTRFCREYVELSETITIIKQLSDGLLPIVLQEVFHEERRR